ncbi:MAG: ANTAR domain-containing protein [Hyphomicrobiales bacterium]|nr:ANTAR domain-containing protein [Hyphomicrobiales bacterium]
MSISIGIPNFQAWNAVILHRPHDAAAAAARQLERIGVASRIVWPELAPADTQADIIFFDADYGYDGQFPWEPGEAPMPLVALLGSEAPGRVEWAMSQGIDAHLLKPIGSGGVYSALVIARHAFAARKALVSEVGDLRERLRRRPVVARAVIEIMRNERIDESAAFRHLGQLAMASRRSIEDAAEALIARYGTSHDARDSA